MIEKGGNQEYQASILKNIHFLTFDYVIKEILFYKTRMKVTLTMLMEIFTF